MTPPDDDPDVGAEDVLAGGGAGRWEDDRLGSGTGRSPARLVLDGARRYPAAAAVMATAVLGIGITAAATVGRDGSPRAARPAMGLSEACTRLVAYRDADSGREWMAAREDLRGVVHRLPADGAVPRHAVWTYADATLGPPTAGPARYLVAADSACRRIGQPLLPRW